jgi:hypothetical protein
MAMVDTGRQVRHEAENGYSSAALPNLPAIRYSEAAGYLFISISPRRTSFDRLRTIADV